MNYDQIRPSGSVIKVANAFQCRLSIHKPRYQHVMQCIYPCRQRRLPVFFLCWSRSAKFFGSYLLKICRSTSVSSYPAFLLWSFACFHVKRSIVAFVLSLLSHLQNWKKSAFLDQIASEFRNFFLGLCNQFLFLWFCIPSLNCVITSFSFILDALTVLRSLHRSEP